MVEEVGTKPLEAWAFILALPSDRQSCRNCETRFSRVAIASADMSTSVICFSGSEFVDVVKILSAPS